MDLGSKQFEWFPYVPVYKGNRDLPPEQQLRLQIRRMNGVQRTGVMGWSQSGVMTEWRDRHLQRFLQDDESAPTVRSLSDGMLMRLRQFMENTKEYENFIIDEQVETDAAALFFHLAPELLMPESLLNEITGAIVQASILAGGDLKNFKEQCDGTKALNATALVASLGLTLVEDRATTTPDAAATPSATSDGSS